MNKKDQIKTLKEHINKLMIIESQKHLYFIDIHFKNFIYKTTTTETRKQYIKEFLKNSLSNYIANLIIINNKESYKILINNYDKDLIKKLCLRITDTIGTTTRIYINSKDKKGSNINYYLTKILNHKPKFIIKNNIEINNIIYSKDKLNKFNNLNIKYELETNKLKKELLKIDINTMKIKSNEKIYKIYRKKHSFYNYKNNKTEAIKELNKKFNSISYKKLRELDNEIDKRLNNF